MPAVLVPSLGRAVSGMMEVLHEHSEEGIDCNYAATSDGRTESSRRHVACAAQCRHSRSEMAHAERGSPVLAGSRLAAHDLVLINSWGLSQVCHGQIPPGHTQHEEGPQRKRPC